ncbi:DUF4376 domain-containing protein [Caviibacterium pharyngocola]|uniref:DUF4376 domain-containing protein n=1 Tax=Caviibacterium pharyngocola TaxID=28159 RepID=A0A2M8RXZ6_9PAST|nr:DUF4376 domain-containing protein [Caviibacterium pharyngocola]PJG83758.1 hypothetical protein CVP04_01305 [Caviibacterium pharyngocola]
MFYINIIDEKDGSFELIDGDLLYLYPDLAQDNLIALSNEMYQAFCAQDNGKTKWIGDKFVFEETVVDLTALLEQQREEVRSKINEFRDLKNRSGVYVEALGKWFDNDDMAYQNLLGFKASLDLIGDYKTAWICADNSVISDFDKAKLTAVITQIMQDKTANVQNALRHKMALAHLDDPANYDYSDGWTRTYDDYLAEQTNG